MIGAVERTIEGSLDILWTNFNEPQGTPHYDLIFTRYENPHNGAQRPYHVVGTLALKIYLVEIGFDAEDAVDWIKKLSEKRSVSIPNVMLNAQQIAPYIP
jgi:hypothetical protein